MSNDEADSYEDGFVDGALWHASQQPTREQVARAVHTVVGKRIWPILPLDHQEQDPLYREDIYEVADAVLALLNGAGS